MDKKYKSNLIVTLLCTIIVMSSLYVMYPNFKFHTYGTVTYCDYLLSLQDEQISLDNYEVLKDEERFLFGDGTLHIESMNLVDNQQYQCQIIVHDQQNKKYIFKHDFTYISSQKDYQLGHDEHHYSINQIQKATLSVINQNNEKIYSHQLKIIPVENIYASNKEYRIENACVSPYYMRLGYLSTTDEDIIKEYPQVSLEYRYLKDEKGDEDDDNNYVVFRKISGQSKDLVNKKYDESFIQEEKKGKLTDKKLSVVVIFSKEKSQKTFVFKMNFTKEAGDVNE